MSLKQKAVSGLSWRISGDLINYAITFIIGIILARLLSPREYGLLGMVTIFTVLTQPFINSGFQQALIRRKRCTQQDFSTVFYFNFVVGVCFYTIVFFSAPYISSFFNEPQLIKITRIIGLIIIIDAATLIQTTLIARDLNFKLQTKVSFVSNILSGILGIFLAYSGYGVWSLVYKTIASHLLKSSLFWINNRWKPEFTFSFSILKELFGFSSKLLVSGILDKIYFNIYNLVIAKYFSAKELGLFTRAKMFKDFASNYLAEAVFSVAFPALSSIQDEPERLRRNYILILNSTMFIVVSLLFGLSAISESLILTLIGEQWKDAIIYLQLMSFVGIFYPMHISARTLFYVYGKSGLGLRLEIFTKLLTIPVILTGIAFGIKYLIIAMIIAGFLEFLVKAYYSGQLIGYSLLAQIKDLIPALLLGLCIGAFMFLIGNLIHTLASITLLIQCVAGTMMFIGLSESFKFNEYLFIKEMILDRLMQFKKRD